MGSPYLLLGNGNCGNCQIHYTWLAKLVERKKMKKELIMKISIKITSLLFVISMLLLCTCSNPLSEEEKVSVTINLGNSGSSRMLVGTGGPNPEHENFDYELYVDGTKLSNVTVTKTAAGATMTATISTGTHSLEVRSYGANPYPSGTYPNLAASGAQILRAIGEPVDNSNEPLGPLNITDGLTISIAMTSATAVADWAQLAEAAGSEPAGTSRKEIILLNASTITANSLVTINRPIILLADGAAAIQRGSPNIYLFTIIAGTLTLGS